jgi:hypothetical protein
VPVVVPPAVPLVPPVVPPHAPALLVVPVEPVVGVLPVVPVVGLPRSVMAPVPLVPEDEVPDELAPELLSMLPVDLQAARLRPIEAARMMLRVVRFILFSLRIGSRSSSCGRTFATAIGATRQYV